LQKVKSKKISTNPSFSEGIILIMKSMVLRKFTLMINCLLKFQEIGNGAIPTGNSRPSNYFKNKPTSKNILIQIFHTKKGKVVAINFGKNGYMVTMIAGKEPTIVKDGNCLPSSEKYADKRKTTLQNHMLREFCSIVFFYFSTFHSLVSKM